VNQGRVEEVADADGKGQNAERSGNEGFGLSDNSSDDGKHGHEAEPTGNKQNTRAARAGELRQFGFHRNLRAVGQGRQSLFGAQFANPVVGVKGRHRQPTSQNHSNESNEISAHKRLLIRLNHSRPRLAVSAEVTKRKMEKFPIREWM